MDLVIREEKAEDFAAVRRVTEQAFSAGDLGLNGEAELIDSLRRQCDSYFSCVACRGDQLVGHSLWTPVRIVDPADRSVERGRGIGLGPMSVAPEAQGQGVGSRLVSTGLKEMRARNVPFVVVLGHPDYYPKFGFEIAENHGIACEFTGLPAPVWMVRIFDSLRTPQGLACYHPAFRSVT